MSSYSRIKTMPRAVWLVLGLVAAALVPVAWSSAQAPEAASTSATQPSSTEAQPPGRYLGPATCAASTCHGSASPAGRDSAAGILQNEYFTWLERDRHSRAYNTLYTEESARIARNYRLEAAPYASAECLGCHTLQSHGEPARRLDLQDGVSCEGCHGPASGWIATHTDAGFTRADFLATGMVDLRNRTTRAETCLGCHLGDADRGVDHELMAAGHPELVFELDNYCLGMPRHWLAGMPSGDGESRSEHAARTWSVGQAVVLRDSLRQLERRARSGAWPDFSVMSCSACHHSLGEGEGRRERGFEERAGLPPWGAARFTLLRELIALLEPDRLPELERRVENVARLVSRLGPAQEVAGAAAAAAELVDRLVPQLESASWSPRAARELVQAIVSNEDFYRRDDVHSAEQTFFALHSLLAYLGEVDGQRHDPLARILNQLDAELADRPAFSRERFRRSLGELRVAIED